MRCTVTACEKTAMHGYVVCPNHLIELAQRQYAPGLYKGDGEVTFDDEEPF